MALMPRRLAVILAVCAALLAGGCAYTGEDLAPKIPQNAQSTTIYAADGSRITTLQTEQNRVEVPLERIPLVLRRAVIAIEDERFYDHSGVDLQAILRAAQTNAESGSVEQGGSTITQQLVKLTLLNSGKTVSRKLQEASLAFQMEQAYSKDEILEIYLNTIYFGNGAYGVEAATQKYFSHKVDTINTTEAATIAGLIHAPNDDDPIAHPDAALARRNLVLDKMAGLGYVGVADHAASKAAPLGLAPTPVEARYPAAHFVEEVKQIVLNDERFGATKEARTELLFNGGLRIYTTIDMRLQAAADQAVAAVLTQPGVDPEAALVSIDPKSGYVKAMVGGRDYFGTQPAAKCNLAVKCDDRAPGRGTGSAFKPFVLAAALTQGISLGEILTAPGCIDLHPPTPTWHVCNADPGEGAPGGTNLVEGTVHSFNTLFAQLVLQVGPDKAVAMANKLGITTKLEPFPSAVLGSNNVEPIDMASAYGTFANRGVHVKETLITKISNADGDVLYEAPHDQEKVLDPGIADEVTGVLQQVIQRGTGTAAKLGRPAAGKTGTGEDYKNAWFCGYTPELSTAVWVGFPTKEIAMSPPTTRITVYGGTWPAQIWQRFMTAALTGQPVSQFVAATTTTTSTVPPTTLVPGESVPAKVPAVVGMLAADAVNVLQKAGFEVLRVEIPDASDPPGTVARQSPAGGATAPTGSTVTIQVAVNTATRTVPNVLHKSRDEAMIAIETAGFAVAVEELGQTRHPPAEDRGKVWRQSPDGGAQAPGGSVVTITVNPS